MNTTTEQTPHCVVHGIPMRFKPDLCDYCDGSGEEPDTFLCPVRCRECQGTGFRLSCERCWEEAADAEREEDL